MERLDSSLQSRADREQFEADQAQIEAALESQAAKRRLAAAPPSPPYNPEYLLINGVPHLPAPPPRDFLRQAFADQIGYWVHRSSPPDKGGYARAIEALDCLDEALTMLGDRAGERAQSTRDKLTKQRERIATALAAYEAIGPGITGPLGLTLIERIATGRKAVADAYTALHFAKPADVRECRFKIDEAEAAGRELDRDIQRAGLAMQLPGLPKLNDFHEAKCATLDLARLPGKRPTVRQIYAAIEAGFRAPHNHAELWIIYEPEAAHELVQWRWRGFSERNA